MKQIYGQKLAMTEVYSKEAKFTVTKVKLFDMSVSQLKNVNKDGYEKMQVTFGPDLKKPSKSQNGHFKGIKPKKYTREIDPVEGKSTKDTITPSEVISAGDIVDVQSTSKGKGFTGTIKRWNFARQPVTHGQSDRTRAPGSIGQGTNPGRVHKGKKMAGRHGGVTTTVKSAHLIFFDESEAIAYLTGSVPGNNGAIVRLSVTDHKEPPVLTLSSKSPKAEDVEVKEEPASDEDPKVTESVDEVVETNDTQESQGDKEATAESEVASEDKS